MWISSLNGREVLHLTGYQQLSLLPCQLYSFFVHTSTSRVFPMNFVPLTAAIAACASSSEPKTAPPCPFFVIFTNLQPSQPSFSMCAFSVLFISLYSSPVPLSFSLSPPIQATFSGVAFAVPLTMPH